VVLLQYDKGVEGGVRQVGPKKKDMNQKRGNGTLCKKPTKKKQKKKPQVHKNQNGVVISGKKETSNREKREKKTGEGTSKKMDPKTKSTK